MDDGGCVDALLAEARARGVDRLDAQVLLAHLLGRDRTWLRAHGDAPVSRAIAAQWAGLLTRRAAGEPVAYLTGQREFHGLMLRVTPDVLDPRPDTEVLVDWALALARAGALPGMPPHVVDLGCGSGAIALALVAGLPGARVTAVDASPAALDVARDNGARLQLAVDWRLGHWLQPLDGETVDLIVSNPPYIAADDVHLDALRAEPRSALVGGTDGLRDLREIVRTAPGRLKPGGWLLLEHGYDQGSVVAQWLQEAGWEAVDQRCDLAGHVRCTGARRGSR